MIDQSIRSLLKRLWQHLAARRRMQFGLLLALTMVCSLAETLSIGALLPFLAAITTPSLVFTHPNALPFIEALRIDSPDQLLLPISIAFGLAVLLAGSARLLLIWTSTRLSFAVGADLSMEIYRRTLYQPYPVHVERNSSEVINGISTKANGVIYGIIGPVLTLVSSGILLVAIVALLLSVEPEVTMIASGAFGGIYVLIARITRKKKFSNSQCIARESTKVVKSLQEGLGGIRDVLIDGSQSFFCQLYRSADLTLRQAQASNQFLGQSPRHAIEAFAMILIVAIAYMLAKQPEDVEKAIPVLGIMALGAQRLLPLMQQAYQAWSSIQGGQASLRDTLRLLDQPLPDFVRQPAANPIPFQQHISVQHLSFRYSPQTPWVLKDVNLCIPKGGRIGFIGSTGSGKSTLLDIIMGLLVPTEGRLTIDGQEIKSGNTRGWQAHIAHVPQVIFLADGTIEDNIAFGQPASQIDRQRVVQAAKQARIADIIETWPEQYQTLVGERGIRLSGGQRQRIGIARALYKKSDVFIFDEATSSLDNETEQAVMEAIDGLSDTLTVLIIAHRLTTLKGCTQIVELDDGGIRRIGSYRDIVTNVA